MKKLSILVLIAIFITGSLTTATAQSPTAEKKEVNRIVGNKRRLEWIVIHFA